MRTDPDDFDRTSPTDNLLPASVTRVICARARTNLRRARHRTARDPGSETQAPVHLEAAAGEEIILEYEQHGVGNFLGSPQAL